MLSRLKAVMSAYSPRAMFESGEITGTLNSVDEVTELVRLHREDPALPSLLDAWAAATRETVAGRIISRAEAVMKGPE